MSSKISIEEWRKRAQRRLPRFAFDYLEGGAEDELALLRNRAALQRMLLIPERLQDVTQCNLQTRLFGVSYPSPLIVAPMGLNGVMWGQGDLALARAAHQARAPFVLSTASNASIQTVAQAAPGEKWFQLYVMQDRTIAERLLLQAQDAGYRVLMLTVDVPISGNRLRDVRNGFELPLRFTPKLIADVLSHPRWLVQLMRYGVPQLVNMQATNQIDSLLARDALIKRSTDRSLTWNSIEWLRAHWSGPIVIKGLLSVQDARRACDYGLEGIVVSNHGGRQLDVAPASIDVLSDIVDAVDGRLEVLVDSGFRRGSDIVKALALGAKGVLIGRPLLYGLAAAGEQGALAILNYLLTETSRTLTLTGLSSIDQLNRRHLMQTAFSEMS